jgi:hypothetical protein
MLGQLPYMKKNWRLFIAAFSSMHNSPITKTEKSTAHADHLSPARK